MDRQDAGRSLNLADEAHQGLVEEALGDSEVLFLDNRSTLVYSGRENDAESWDKMQQWFIQLRRVGKSVILVDHASRSGSSRGTSKREDILNTVIHLKRPDDYEAEDGARFEVHLEKARGIFGVDAQSFEARLETKDGADFWRVKSMDDITEAKVGELTGEGRTIREIADELKIGRDKVHRIQKKLREQPKEPCPTNSAPRESDNRTNPKNGGNPTGSLSDEGLPLGRTDRTAGQDGDPFETLKDPALVKLGG